MLATGEYPQVLELQDAGDRVSRVAFTANGSHLVCGGWAGVRVWRVKDGKQVAKVSVGGGVVSIAVSNDGRWIAAGTSNGGRVLVWNAATYERVFTGQCGSDTTWDVDFSPDSTRLVSADCNLHAATIWDILAGRKVRTLTHTRSTLSAKYSPQGDRIATATGESIRIWDSNDGRLLVNVKVRVSYLLSGLLWYNDHLFVRTQDNRIKEINVVTGSSISELPVPRADSFSRIALSQNGKLIACSADKTITFWDTTTHSQLGLIKYSRDILSIAFSSDSRFLAFTAYGPFLSFSLDRKIIVKELFHSILVPELLIDSVTLDAWKNGHLANAEASLSAAVPVRNRSHHVEHILASRALVRARLGKWDGALVDAVESIKIKRSLFGYVAKCVALVGKGEEVAGFQEYDIAFKDFPEHITLLRLVKAVVLLMVRKHVDAISCMDDLITHAHVWADPALYVVQAYIYLSYGNKHMECRDYGLAVQSLETSRIKLGNRTHRPPLIVSLISGWEFEGLAVTIQQCLGEALLAAGRTQEAGECVLCVTDQEISMTEPIKTWVSEFKYRCCSKLEALGDRATDARRYDEAVSHYTTALSQDPPGPQDLLVKRSRAYTEKGKWGDALNDANEAIKRDPSSSLGYSRKFAALHCMGRHDNATEAFNTMLVKMSESSDPVIRERSRRDVRPEQIVEQIHTSIENATRNSPQVLINTISGRLCNKSEQAAAFESTAAFTTLIMSMSTHIDHALIHDVVGEFYRYAMLSHTWEGNEPLYEKVVKIVVHDLEASPTHEKLRMFCKVARDEGFIWAWSDTCCINKSDHFVLQEALVSMFKWYEGSTMTIIFLCDVDELAELGALIMSRWNSRGWTLQEYHASKVVRIYTKNWTPYLGLTTYNHKESPEIVSEMQQATGIPAQSLMALQPGLSDIRVKLHLAATRQTTRAEDAAYSLLGIFSIPLPVTYGEGDKALGRLLSQLLTSSGDTSILAWMGTPGSFNSCLPANIVVFSQPPTLHIPPAIAEARMGAITARLHTSPLDLNLVTKLYDQLNGLSMPFFGGQRMKLPCLAFKIDHVSTSWSGAERVFHAQAGALGVVDIKTEQDLSQLDSLHLIHPWIDFLLDRRAAGNVVEMTAEDDSELDEFFDASTDLSSTSPLASAPFLSVSLTKAQAREYEFIARTRRPFGALLLAPTRLNVAEYKRIATEGLIKVRVEELTSATLERLIQGVQVLDVL